MDDHRSLGDGARDDLLRLHRPGSLGDVGHRHGSLSTVQGIVVIDITCPEFVGTSSHPHPAKANFFVQPVDGICPFTTVDTSLVSKFKIRS